jgi:hypothetical protein
MVSRAGLKVQVDADHLPTREPTFTVKLECTTAPKRGADLSCATLLPRSSKVVKRDDVRKSADLSFKGVRVVQTCTPSSAEPAIVDATSSPSAQAVANSSASRPAIGVEKTTSVVAGPKASGPRAPATSKSTLSAAVPVRLNAVGASSSAPTNLTAVERFLARQRMMGKKVDEAAASLARTQAASPGLCSTEAQPNVATDRHASSQGRTLQKDAARKEDALARFVRQNEKTRHTAGHNELRPLSVARPSQPSLPRTHEFVCTVHVRMTGSIDCHTGRGESVRRARIPGPGFDIAKIVVACMPGVCRTLYVSCTLHATALGCAAAPITTANMSRPRHACSQAVGAARSRLLLPAGPVLTVTQTRPALLNWPYRRDRIGAPHLMMFAPLRSC